MKIGPQKVMYGNSYRKSQVIRALKFYMQKSREGTQFDMSIAILVITAIFVHQETTVNIPNPRDKKIH